MKRALFAIAITGLIVSGGLFAFFLSYAQPDLAKKIQSGDIVFQTTQNGQSMAIMAATGSVITHMGIASKETDGEVSIIETGKTVRALPFDAWLEKGRFGRVAIKRIEGVDEFKGQNIAKAARKFSGKPYDPYFFMDDARLYCSELVFKAYKANSVDIGKAEKFSDLGMDNEFVKDIIQKRISGHPLCAKTDTDKCLLKVMAEYVVTPASIYKDPKLITVYSNYVF